MKHNHPKKILAFQADGDLITRVTQETQRLRNAAPGARYTVSDVLRTLVERGLAASK